MQKLTIKQWILDIFCILLCVGALIYVLVLYHSLPEQIPMNFDLNGNITNHGKKTSVFILLGIMFLMTVAFSILLRVKSIYRHMNVPWPIPWGKQGLVIQATKDLICWCDLCVTVDLAYLLYATINGNVNSIFIWIPYLALIPLLVWYILHLRKICKG